MSGPFQVGDIIAIANVAKKVYEYGWGKRFNASRKYNEFGEDVDALRYHLDLLAAIIQSADSKLLSYSRTADLKWHPRSLLQIIGDCGKTIDECNTLILDHSSYTVDAGPWRNIKWNLLVQDEVDALQFRIRQHTAKIQLALAPFEIDLLTSIQRSIHEMHSDLRDQIEIVRREVLRLRGVVVPDVQHGLDRMEAQTTLLSVPVVIRDRLDHIYSETTSKPPSLEELADAFVAHFHESTYSFRPVSRMARDKVPPDKAYLNLLKCIWLVEKLKESDEFRNEPEGSHWQSYLAELEKVLSDESRRFDDELVTPRDPILTDNYLIIWRKENKSSTVIIPREFEVVLNAKISQRRDNGEQQDLKLQLLRYLDETNGQEFTINIYGGNDGNSVIETLDFNLRTTALIPKYVTGDSTATPQRLLEPPTAQRGFWPHRMSQNSEIDRSPSSLFSQPQQNFKVTLGMGRKLETFNFKRLKDAMAFQHAITGYFVQESKSFSANAAFVLSNQGSRVPRYKAYVQVWYPIRKEADLSATAELAPRATMPMERVTSASFTSSPQSSTTAFSYPITGGISPDLRNPLGQYRRDTGDTIRPVVDRIPNRQTNPSSLGIFPIEIGRSPPRLGGFGMGRGPEVSTSPEDILPPRVPLEPPTGSERHTSLAQSDQASSRSMSIFSTIRSRTRNSSTSIAWTERSGSSSGSGNNSTISADAGGGVIGTLHTPPPKPMVVMLVDNEDTGERSMVTLDLSTSEIRPDLCDCRRSDEQGRRCRDVCLEQNRQGSGSSRRSFLQARMFKAATAPSSNTGWDLSRLAYTRRNDESINSSPLENLNRVTITFDRASDRIAFCGHPICGCSNRGKAGLETDRQRRECVMKNHRGIVGCAKEYYLKELREYERAELSRTHVVNGPRLTD